eukprot:scaffold33559_cov63-Phaeocystis_antarctica.AAC.2
MSPACCVYLRSMPLNSGASGAGVLPMRPVGVRSFCTGQFQVLAASRCAPVSVALESGPPLRHATFKAYGARTDSNSVSNTTPLAPGGAAATCLESVATRCSKRETPVW